jgi:PAS domain S-box-containing protein
VLVGVVANLALNRANTAANFTANLHLLEMRANGNLSVNLSKAQHYESEFFLSSEAGNRYEMEAYRVKLENWWALVAVSAEAFQVLPPESELRNHADELATLVAQCRERLAVVLGLMSTGMRYQEVQDQYQEYRSAVHELEDRTSHTFQHSAERMLVSQQELIQTQSILQHVVIITPGVAVVFAIFLGLAITRSISRPVSRLSETTEKIAAGDLTQMAEVTSDDELGELASSFNRMTETLQKSKDELQRKNRELEATNDQLGSANETLQAEITNRKQAEEALQLTQFSIDHAADAVFWVEPDGKLAYANDAACRYLGYSRDELLSMKLHDIHPAMAERVWEEVWERAKKRGAYTVETYHRAKDGRMIPVEVTVNHIEFGGRELHCTFAHDITRRKQAQGKIERAAGEWRTTFDSISDMVSIQDKDFRLLRVNKAFADAFKDETTGPYWQNLL